MKQKRVIFWLKLLKYDDKRYLKPIPKKCEYVIDLFKGNNVHNVYKCITSRLVHKAAVLISELKDIVNWLDLRELGIY